MRPNQNKPNSPQYIHLILFLLAQSLSIPLPSCPTVHSIWEAPFPSTMYHSLTKCLRVDRCCKQKAWIKSCIHDEPDILLSCRSRCPSNYTRSNEAYIHRHFPPYPQRSILQKSIQLNQCSCFYDWLFHYKTKSFQSICWAKLLT